MATIVMSDKYLERLRNQESFLRALVQTYNLVQLSQKVWGITCRTGHAPLLFGIPDVTTSTIIFQGKYDKALAELKKLRGVK